jgi:hypothetical protein
MSTDIIPFESASLPAYFQHQSAATLNEDLTAHQGAGFPVVSIKGKTFTTVRDGERTVIMNPLDPDSPASYIDMVLVKANKNVSKVFYAKGFKEGESDGLKPDCFSSDGIKPDARVEKPVHSSCTLCPNNVWGSRISESGQKGKACQDAVRLAIAAPGQLNDPYLLRVPPASIRGLGEYGSLLKKRGVGYNMVVTRFSFDPEMATPKLMLKPIGFLTEAQYQAAAAMGNEPIVQQILGSIGVEAVAFEAPAASAPPAPVAPAPAKPAAPKAVAKPVPAPAPAPAPAAKKEPALVVDDVNVDDIDLNNINFDE